MKIRVKDLWMVRTAFERLLRSQDTSVAECCDPLWTAYLIYQEERKQAWNRLGLNKPLPFPKWWHARKRAQLMEQFNDEVAELAEEEIEFTPVPADKFQGTVVDYLGLKSKGIIGA